VQRIIDALGEMDGYGSEDPIPLDQIAPFLVQTIDLLDEAVKLLEAGM
jgi:hypothetical protein